MPGWTRDREADLAERLAGLLPTPGAISVACGWPGEKPVTVSVRARPDTRFLSCSSCKPVTAAEQGLLDLDAEPAAGLSVRQLLSHTAGLAGDLYVWAGVTWRGSSTAVR